MSVPSSPLVVQGLTKRFDDTVALDDVSIDVRQAELFGLVGPDGGGKTTLFRILTTLLVPDSGTVRPTTDGTTDPGRLTIED